MVQVCREIAVPGSTLRLKLTAVLNHDSHRNKARQMLYSFPVALAPGTVLQEVALRKCPALGKASTTLSQPPAPILALPDNGGPLSAAVYLS